jgi:AcrR family transcriptional regulator
MESNSYHHGDLKNALITAGIEILKNEGLGGLSLRNVAKQAGVSHSAPYAHFADKQALIAAIATEGHTQIFKKISTLIEQNPDQPAQQLVKAALAYLEFGLEESDLFKITFAGFVEQERDYPALAEITHQNFELIQNIAVRCKEIGVFKNEPADLLAQSLWGAVHGLIALIQQKQVSSIVLDRYSPPDLLLFTLNQMTLIPISNQDK